MKIYNHQFQKFDKQNKYLTEKDFNTFLETTPLPTSLKNYLTLEKKALIKKHNNKFLNRILQEKKNYFDTMFQEYDPNIKLDTNQLKAIIADENLLVIAGAGAGKTTTMAAKVKYLVDSGFQETEILVLSFTKKASEEIGTIIHKYLNCPNVTVTTFHSLGLDLIKKSGRDIEKVIEENDKYKILSQYLKKIAFQDKNYLDKLNEAFSSYLNLTDNYKNYSTFEEYHQNAYHQKFQKTGFDLDNYIQNQIELRRKRKKTIKGEFLRSKEEVDIANFLFLNQIDYTYERTYKDKSKNITSHPDFFIQQLELENYIEHFGLDENLDNKMYDKKTLQEYLNKLNLKRKYIGENDHSHRFILTFSKTNETTYLQSLKEQLIQKGYTLKRRKNDSIFQTLMETDTESYFSSFILDILIPFITNFKKNNLQPEDFYTLKENTTEELANQLTIIEPIYYYYQETLQTKHYIDFDDMINIAHSIIHNLKEKQLGVDYNYLIIDEYQDISNQRYNLTKALADLYNAKIMAVGDDWQTIYSFAGADLSLFHNFKKYLNDAKYIPIENTYRNSQELIDIAGTFVQKNAFQIKKELKSTKHQKIPIEIFIYNDSNKLTENNSKAKAIATIITQIEKNHPKHKILLVGRYQKDKDNLLYSDLFSEQRKKIICKTNPQANIDFLTIHKSKGLGYDDVILINAIDTYYGFPSKIETIPLITLLKPPIKEPIPYPEERRLFYVAMTRTKNKFYIVIPQSKVSPFIKEIMQDHPDGSILIHHEIIKNTSPLRTNYHCPKCNHHLNMINYKNTDFYIYKCSNNICNFQTMFPKKLEPLEICPKCKDIVTYRYTRNNNEKIYKCFNPDCNFTLLKIDKEKISQQ